MYTTTPSISLRGAYTHSYKYLPHVTDVRFPYGNTSSATSSPYRIHAKQSVVVHFEDNPLVQVVPFIRSVCPLKCIQTPVVIAARPLFLGVMYIPGARVELLHTTRKTAQSV